jgi:AcrR family transcriptional regulator
MPPSNRERILEGAIECIHTKGVAATTTRDIAAAANASLSSIPYHFGTKEALLDEALIRALERYTLHVRDLGLARSSDPAGQLTYSMDALLNSFEDARPLLVSLLEAWTHAVHNPALRPKLAAERQRAVTRVATIIEESLSQEVAAALDVPALANVFMTLVDGLIVQWLVDPASTLPADSLLQALGVIAAFGAATEGAVPQL